jgi:hypothetical protein
MTGVVLLEVLALLLLARTALAYRSAPAPVLPVYEYRAQHRAKGEPLEDRREPAGRPAMREVIASMSADDVKLDSLTFVDTGPPLSPVYVAASVLTRLVPAPQWTPKHTKGRPDWATTEEHEQTGERFFADLPDDGAVQRVWAGTGRAA